MKSISFLIAFLYIIKTLSKEVSEEFSRKPSEDFIREWEGMMVNFTPEDIKTFMVHSYEVDVILIHEVSNEDVNLPFKGAFFIHNEKEIKAEVKIFNPKGKSLMKTSNNEDIFNFNCSLAGFYQIVILNKERKNFKITLATHFFNEKLPINQDVSSMEGNLEDSLKNFKSLLTEIKFAEQQRKSHTFSK